MVSKHEMEQIQYHVIAVLSSFTVFFLAFWAAWKTSMRKSCSFQRMDLPHKADWCSRWMSTLHGVIVVPGFIITVAIAEWDWDTYEPITDPLAMHVIMCITVGYFLFDFLATLWFKLPDWHIFAVHHVLAATPYIINLFSVSCWRGTYVLSLFMLVEIATLTLNLQVFLEQSGRETWPVCRKLFYITYGLWILSRLALPLYLLYIMYKYVFLPRDASGKGCYVTGLICAHLIVIFCFAVFITHLTPQLVKRMKKKQAFSELKKAGLSPSASAPLSRAGSTATTPVLHEMSARPTMLPLDLENQRLQGDEPGVALDGEGGGRQQRLPDVDVGSPLWSREEDEPPIDVSHVVYL
eukprot:PhM_4_TR4192/c0_g1_i1/m.82631